MEEKNGKDAKLSPFPFYSTIEMEMTVAEEFNETPTMAGYW